VYGRVNLAILKKFDIWKFVKMVLLWKKSLRVL
jgi:hypothetical protein